MKPLHFVCASALVLLVQPTAALSDVGLPVLGEEHVQAQVGIIGTGFDLGSYYLQTPPYDNGTTATPFVMTLGNSNAIHGVPSNPVAGGLLLPGTLDASNALLPANAPLNLMNAGAARSWDRKSFAYSMGEGPSFSVGVAVGEWGQQAYALYHYSFEHTNLSGRTESLLSVGSHVDAGRLYLLVPNRPEHQDFTLTYLQASFNYEFIVSVSPDDPAKGGRLYGHAGLSKTMVSTAGDLNLPPGYHDLGNGIAGQAIPSQSLTMPPFDLAPGQLVTVSVRLRVDAVIEGSGIAPPILYAVAGDPVALAAGTSTPNFTLTYMPVAVPEPQTWALMLAGLAACLPRWRRLAGRASLASRASGASGATRAATEADRSLDRGCTNFSSTLTRITA